MSFDPGHIFSLGCFIAAPTVIQGMAHTSSDIRRLREYEVGRNKGKNVRSKKVGHVATGILVMVVEGKWERRE